MKASLRKPSFVKAFVRDNFCLPLRALLATATSVFCAKQPSVRRWLVSVLFRPVLRSPSCVHAFFVIARRNEPSCGEHIFSNHEQQFLSLSFIMRQRHLIVTRRASSTSFIIYQYHQSSSVIITFLFPFSFDLLPPAFFRAALSSSFQACDFCVFVAAAGGTRRWLTQIHPWPPRR